MKIASLVPFVSGVFIRMGKSEALIEVSTGSSNNDDDVQGEPPNKSAESTDLHRFKTGLCDEDLNIEHLISMKPSCIITTVRREDPSTFIPWAEAFVEQHYNSALRIHHVEIKTLKDMYDTIERLGSIGSFALDARQLVAKIKAQLMQWAHTFYHRSKGKKVLVLSGIEPCCVAPIWLADIVSSLGAKPVESANGSILTGEVSWSEIRRLAPDVLVVAPVGATLSESVRTVSILQTLPGWEDIPAVKRGEVGFCSGDSFEIGSSFLHGAAILASLIAGLDSGYITPRDVYYKLRFVELQRHRFL